MNILDYTLHEFKDLLIERDIPQYRASQLFKGIYLGYEIDEISNLPMDLREYLKNNFIIGKPKIIKNLISKDGTEKFLLKYEDNNIVEAVLMKYSYGNSICISSQIGCKMGCSFCASSDCKMVRNLSPGEMIGEILAIKTYTKEKINKVVIMGTGEPLDNYDNILKFINILSKDYSLNIGERNITLSTCGIVPKIYRLADEELSINLAISLHAADDTTRLKIMPIAKTYSIHDILKAVKYYFKKTGRRITFEYILIDRLNDSKEHALKLSYLLKDISCHVNIIPVNKIVDKNFCKPSNSKIDDFIYTLTKNGVNVTKRRALGADIKSSCGQLKNSYLLK